MHRKRGNGSTPSIPPETKAGPRRRGEYRRIASGKVRWHRWRPRRKDKRATGHIAQTERAPFRMVNGRYERDRPGNHIPRAKRGLYYKPMRQKRRKLGADKAQAVNEEVEKLLRAGSITEVKYPEWLANPVVVKKKKRKVESLRRFHRPE
ncbi:unnamed protein product [Microthlaspi erraticum]|uniref:Uncharacterized protein n=1 Tax=Microthlaspi erraticum TaxID=1685480 RepID=A0A6D2L4Z9_9BRAS|nr:unnamed protein product [Microthlaspi erraticum]